MCLGAPVRAVQLRIDLGGSRVRSDAPRRGTGDALRARLGMGSAAGPAVAAQSLAPPGAARGARAGVSSLHDAEGACGGDAAGDAGPP